MWYQMCHEGKKLPWGTSTVSVQLWELSSKPLLYSSGKRLLPPPLPQLCSQRLLCVSFLSSSAGPLCWDY